MQISDGVIKPEKNKWGDNQSGYQTAIEGAGFAFRNLAAPEKNRGAEPGKENNGGKTDDPYSFHQGADSSSNPGFAEKTPDQQYQDILQQAAQKGLPVVVVFGSKTAMDTEKQSTQTLKQNMKEGEAMYLYVDTDKLDPNSDLGKVARRNQSAGQGLGESGKADLAFTGIYTVEKKADGSLGLGKSTATFWGGREEISAIMKDQLRYAKAATLNLGGDTKPAPGPSDTTPGPSEQRPVPGQDDTNPGVRPAPSGPSDSNPRPGGNDSKPDQKPDQKPDSQPEKEQGKEDKRRFEEEQKRKEKEQREKELKEFAKKNYSLEEYATGWGRFLERSEMEEGPMRDALGEMGKQIFSGEFDGQKLADLMSKIGPVDAAAVEKSLAKANDELKQSGLKINVDVDSATGLVKSMTLASGLKPGDPAVTVGATSKGEPISNCARDKNQNALDARPAPFKRASMLLAKRAEPAACP